MGSAIGEKVPEEMRKRFFERFCAEPNTGCWLWERNHNHYGYGMINRLDGNRRTLRAHRVSWIIHNGPIPNGKIIMHKCDTPSCVNPQHLQLGTHSDNQCDKVKKGRHHHKKQSHCKRGHEFTAKNTIKRKNGGRGCKACKELHYRSTYIPHPVQLKTHCKWGHAFDAKNTYVRKNGIRKCRMCERLVSRKQRKGE